MQFGGASSGRGGISSTNRSLASTLAPPIDIVRGAPASGPAGVEALSEARRIGDRRSDVLIRNGWQRQDMPIAAGEASFVSGFGCSGSAPMVLRSSFKYAGDCTRSSICRAYASRPATSSRWASSA